MVVDEVHVDRLAVAGPEDDAPVAGDADAAVAHTGADTAGNGLLGDLEPVARNPVDCTTETVMPRYLSPYRERKWRTTGASSDSA